MRLADAAMEKTDSSSAVACGGSRHDEGWLRRKDIMKDPREYLSEIDENLRKLQAQGKVTATENALFGMIDGLAGLQRTLLERVTNLEQQLGLQGTVEGSSPRVSGTNRGRNASARRRATDVGARSAGDDPVSTYPSPEPAPAHPARGPDTRNASEDRDGTGEAPIPVAAARSSGTKSRGGNARGRRAP
jgi:hypothetical protein